MMKVDKNHHARVKERTPPVTSDPVSDVLSEVFFGHGGTMLSSVMNKNVATMDHTRTAHEAATLMTEKRIGCMIITAYGKPFGIVTEKDLVRVTANLDISPKCLLLSFLASRPLISASPTQTIQEAVEIMEKNYINHLPIVEKNKIVGIVTTRDLAMSLLYT